MEMTVMNIQWGSVLNLLQFTNTALIINWKSSSGGGTLKLNLTCDWDLHYTDIRWQDGELCDFEKSNYCTRGVFFKEKY